VEILERRLIVSAKKDTRQLNTTQQRLSHHEGEKCKKLWQDGMGQRTSCPSQLFLKPANIPTISPHHTLPHPKSVKTIQTTFESNSNFPRYDTSPEGRTTACVGLVLAPSVAPVITTMSVRPPCMLSILCALHCAILRRPDVGR
jgi:hypothetical protein